MLFVCVLMILVFPNAPTPTVQLHAQTVVTSTRSGRWSDPATWSSGRLPGQGEPVVIARGHSVAYDVHSDVEVGRLRIQGSLVFARDRYTRLDVGNVIVDSGGYLEMGTTAAPIPATAVAELRFAISPAAACTGGTGFVEQDTGLWVFNGGRWEVHGAPVRVTWTKLVSPVTPGTTALQVADDVSDWQPGAWAVVTPTDLGSRLRTDAGTSPQYEERQIVRATRRTGYTEVVLSGALQFRHDATPNAAAEVALLSRNVVVTAKYPGRPMNGHTMYMMGATGGVSYAEFRDLGDLGCLGRYPVHFHMMGDTSRGLRVLGASIWRSDNNLLDIHGSSGVTIEDTVGYNATGVGYFVGEPAPGGHPADDALGHQLAFQVHILLTIAVPAAGLHGLHRPHAPVDLVAAALEDHGLAGTLVGAGEE